MAVHGDVVDRVSVGALRAAPAPAVAYNRLPTPTEELEALMDQHGSRSICLKGLSGVE